MAIKNMRLKFTILFLALTSLCFAQFGDDVEKNMENEGSFFLITDDENNTTIVQEFTWDASDDVFMYKFVIEKQDELGFFELYDEQDTEDNFADCVLDAGEYRYKIGLYNFLGIIELETDWTPVSVRKAVKPEITDVSPDFLYIETGSEIVLTVEGKELSEDATFKLTNMESGLVLPAVVIDKDLVKNKFSIRIDSLLVEPGKYEVSARNDGGLSYSYSPITLSFSDAFDICISVGIGLSCSTHEDVMKDYLKWPFGFRTLYNHPSSHIGITFIPYKGEKGFMGGSVLFSTFTLHYEDNDYYYNYYIDLNGLVWTLCFNYERPLGSHFIFDAHIGGGVTLMNLCIIYRVGVGESNKVLGLAFRAGAAIQFYFRRHFYFELNVDYVLNLFKGINIQYLDPCLSMGWRF